VRCAASAGGWHRSVRRCSGRSPAMRRARSYELLAGCNLGPSGCAVRLCGITTSEHGITSPLGWRRKERVCVRGLVVALRQHSPHDTLPVEGCACEHEDAELLKAVRWDNKSTYQCRQQSRELAHSGESRVAPPG
jgi:hypothetical protein